MRKSYILTLILVLMSFGLFIGVPTQPVHAANCDGLPSTSGIIPHGTYTLTDNCTITGTFVIIPTTTVTINGNGIFAIDGGDSHQIFDVASGAKLELNNVTLRNGYDNDNGGAINNDGIVTIRNSTLRNNNAPNGGAIYNDGKVTITNSELVNSYRVRSGGAIYNDGTVEISDSELISNSADYGGAIYNDGRVTITNSKLGANDAVVSGGAIYNDSGGTVSITNSTLIGNRADGGAIYNNTGAVNITNSTLSSNIATRDSGVIHNVVGGTVSITNNALIGNRANGSVIYNDADSTVNLTNTIISANTVSSGENCDNAGTINDNGGNLEDANTCGLSSGFNTDPLLGAFNGSYYPLQAGSPAIDAAPTCAGLTTDQIGTSRPQGSACDIGAIEMLESSAGGDTANCDGLPATSGTIPTGTYTLTGDCTITGTFMVESGTITINGGGFEIDGGGSYQIFNVSSGATLELNNVTLRRGKTVTRNGGAIANEGIVTITNSTLSNNHAAYGGAIANEGTVTITNSTLSGNLATYGGAIYNNGTFTVNSSILSDNSTILSGGAIYNKGTVNISNSTLTRNRARHGGAIDNDGMLTISNSTLSVNVATTQGGAINNQGTVNLTNTIISGNTSINYCYNDGGTINDNGGNLEDRDTCGLSSGFNTDPLLGEFNGSYYPLQEGSPAIDGAPTCGELSTDQIGTPRPQGNACDIGAIEYKTE